jgi:hypothetical protein
VRLIERAVAALAAADADRAAHAEPWQRQDGAAVGTSTDEDRSVLGADRRPADHPFGADERLLVGSEAKPTHGQWPQRGGPRPLTREPWRAEPFMALVAARLRPTQQRHGPHALEAKAALAGESRKLGGAWPPPPLGTAMAVDAEGAPCGIERGHVDAVAEPRQPGAERFSVTRLGVYRQPGRPVCWAARPHGVELRPPHGGDRRAA